MTTGSPIWDGIIIGLTVAGVAWLTSRAIKNRRDVSRGAKSVASWPMRKAQATGRKRLERKAIEKAAANRKGLPIKRSGGHPVQVEYSNGVIEYFAGSPESVGDILRQGYPHMSTRPWPAPKLLSEWTEDELREYIARD